MATILYTSLLEIYQHRPCPTGWRKILQARGKTQADSELFPLADCVASNGFADVCWLLGRRKKELEIIVQAGKRVAESVQGLKSTYAAAAADAAADADAADAAYAADAAAADAAAYAAAAYAAAAAAAAADAAAAYAAADADAARTKQKELNCQFLLEAIREYEARH